VDLWIFLSAAVLLSLERICYVWVWRRPDAFRAVCVAGPIDGLRSLFYGFKALQCAVFAGWCYVYGHGSVWPITPDVNALAIGGLLVVTGQMLNASVFFRLGTVGVFYGNRFGYHVPWVRGFPFSLFDHPQYVGAVISIWGLFLMLRFPHADWSVLPLLETLYYTLGARFER
jgi:methylene-fatty-acyl-phospholipid synthase